jgi:molybdopterin converting factor small subunit
MADATSDGRVTLEMRGFLADRLAALGRRRGTRIAVDVPLVDQGVSVGALLTRLVEADARYGLLFDAEACRLPDHVEAVLNDRVLDLQGGLQAELRPGDVLTFIPAHAGGQTGSSLKVG